jgi:hypothetical protein
MKEKYQSLKFKEASIRMIVRVNGIIAEYQTAGFVLTVRQLYYQLVSRDVIPNSERSYQNLITLVTNARIAGHIDWDAIEDRTRSFIVRSRWSSPNDILRAVARQYHSDPWLNQEIRPVVIVEKEALVGVFEKVCNEYDVPLLAARGYPSASVMREFANDMVRHGDRPIHILHFGDHDPSGIDMSRDLQDRIDLFSRGAEYTFERLALNYDQIEEWAPPPNPAKMTDSRFESYRERFGDSSWELDALPPQTLVDLATAEIQKFVDEDAWAQWQDELDDTKLRLEKVADDFE